MGKGRRQMFVANRSLETVKMTMRMLYAIFIWYEFWLWPEQIDWPLERLTLKLSTLHKAPFWAASIVIYIIEITEIFCARGRALTRAPAWYLLGVFVALYSQPW